MKVQDINYLRENGRIRQGILESIFTAMPLVIGGYLPSLMFTYFILTGMSTLNRFTGSMLLFFYSVAFTGFLKQQSKRKIYPLIIGLDSMNAKIAVREVLNKLNWTYSEVAENQYLASTSPSWFSWGETVRIFYFDNKIWANSVGSVAPITFGKDRRNIRRLKDEISKIVNAERTIVQKNESL